MLGWYIVPELEHFRCYKVFVTETRSERIAYVVGLYVTVNITVDVTVYVPVA